MGENHTSASISALLDSAKVSAVTYWGDRLCIARLVDDGYEIEVFQKNSSEKLVKIFSIKLDGVYHLDGMTSEDFLIVYGSSAVATEIFLLRWDAEKFKVVNFEDNRFNGDSRLHPDILRKSGGFQLLTYGNLNDMGSEPDMSKWYVNIYTFEKGSLKSVKKKAFSERFCACD